MAKLRTQHDGATANHLTPADRAALGGYRAGGTDRAHYEREYHWLRRAYGLPTVSRFTAVNGERCYEFGLSDDTPHPGTPPRVFERLAELVELLLNAPTVVQQATLF